MKINELMTCEVASVTPGATLKEVAAILVDRRISGLPVCGPDGAVLGVVSEADILRQERGPEPPNRFFGGLIEGSAEKRSKASARTAGEAMTSPPVTIEPRATVTEAAQLMLARNVNRLPVVHNGRLVGIVTRADLVRAFLRTDDEVEREIREDVVQHILWLDPRSIDVQVEDGAVTLTGTTDTHTSAMLVATFARRVPGVVAVTSELAWALDDRERGLLAASRSSLTA